MTIKPKENLREEFRRGRGQETSYVPTPPSRSRRKSSPYEVFLKKYENLDEYIEDLDTLELTYFFRETAQRNGYKYVISNIQKDRAIMKKLLENFSCGEICGMIEFLYMSEQDYLDKSRLSPNLLASRWVNTIYADMQLWIKDEYTPNSKQKHKNKEWTSSISDDESKIGKWE